MRISVLLATACAAGSAASAQPMPAKVPAFQAQLAEDRLEEAGDTLKDIVLEERRRDPSPRARPLLQALIGQLVLARSGGDAAQPYLWTLDTSALPAPVKAETLLAVAESFAGTAQQAKAEEALLQARQLPLTPAQLRRTELAKAQLALSSDPASAFAIATPLLSAPTPAERWQSAFLAARAKLLLGRVAEARPFADRAWQDAALAPARLSAPAHTALLRAALAAASGDQVAEFAMLAAANAADHELPRDFEDQLPPCRAVGVSPDDWAQVSLVSSPDGVTGPVLMRASSVRAGTALVRGIGRGDLLKGDSLGPGGTLVTLRCRSEAAKTYRPPLGTPNPASEWLLAHGVFSGSGDMTDEDQLNAAAEDVATLERRHGTDSTLLLWPRLELLSRLIATAMAGGNVPRGSIRDLHAQVDKAIAKLGGPAWLIADFVPGDVPDESRWVAERTAQLTGLSPEHAADDLIGLLATSKPPEYVTGPLLKLVTGRLPAGDLRREVLLKSMAGLSDKALSGPARAELLRTGVARRFCGLADSEPTVSEPNFDSSHFPKAPLRQAMAGVSVFEVDVSASGTPGKPRAILVAPQRTFADAALTRLPGVRYHPPLYAGRASGCAGDILKVRWALPPKQDGDNPFLIDRSSSDPAQETTALTGPARG